MTATGKLVRLALLHLPEVPSLGDRAEILEEASRQLREDHEFASKCEVAAAHFRHAERLQLELPLSLQDTHS